MKGNNAPWSSGPSSLGYSEAWYEGDALVLKMEMTLTDPQILTAPIKAQKLWLWNPEQTIDAYDSCVIPNPELLIEGPD